MPGRNIRQPDSSLGASVGFSSLPICYHLFSLTGEEVNQMARKKKRIPKSGPVWRRSAEQATLDAMPKFNGFACGVGPHGDTKYNRAKQKRSWQTELSCEEARTRGPLLSLQML